MASPFRVFRKNVKPLLVVFGVMLVFVFLIGDYVGYLGGGSGGRGDADRGANATAVSWDGGSLTNLEVRSLVDRRHVTNEFLQFVEGMGMQAAAEAGIEPRPLRVQRMLGPETPQQGVEQHVVRTKIFADAAREAGIQVTDGAVVQYLNELGRGNVTPDQMRVALEQMRKSGWRVSIQFVIDALREEMLARNYMASHQFAFETVTPEQRWDDWLSVNDRVVVEAAAIPVDSFVVDVPPPTDAQLETFFDENKKREPQPDPQMRYQYGGQELPMSMPGFAIPRKIDVQFIEANFDESVAKVENEITDEEIAKYYEDNKELFIKADMGLIDETEASQDAALTDDGASQEAATKDATSEDASTTESTETAPATDSGAESIEQPAATESDETPESPPESEPAAEGDQSVEPAEGDQSSMHPASSKSKFRLAAFLQDPEADSAETETADESAETTEPAGSETPAAVADSIDESTTTDAVSEVPASETPASDPQAAEKPKEYEPLEEVSDIIRRDIAERRVADKLQVVMDDLISPLNGEFTNYISKVFDAQGDDAKVPEPPAALSDLESLAKKHDLKFGKTGPMSALELRETPVGKSTRSDTNVLLLLNLFTTKDLELFQPVLSHDVNGNRFLMMKISDTPGRVPKLAEVKDDVIRAWKLQKAAELALKAAEDLAKKAQDSGSPLVNYFEDDQSIQVVSTDAFAELTGGEVAVVQGEYRQQPFRLSQPEGIVAPGPDFLRRVFELKEGEVGAVLNHDKSLAYVVRVVEHQYSPDELRTAYLAEANNWEGLRLKLYEHSQQAATNLIADVAADMKWERDHDQYEEDASVEPDDEGEGEE